MEKYNNWKLKFYTIWAGQAVSLITSAILQMAIIFYLTEKTGSAMVLSMASLVGFLPYAVFGPAIGVLVDRHDRKKIMICQNVTIMPGVKIGDGAIIAANSTVVKSVEPYSIYGGNPAKFIKKRFSDEKIEFLLKLEWWNWSEEEIFDNLEILTSEAGLEELMNKYSKRDEIN